MQRFETICRNCNLVKFKIRYKWSGKEKEIALQDILPRNFCVLAFHSIYPYMYTYFTGGWFNWVNYGEDVIVNCPSPEGIAMYVKSCTRNPSGNIRIETMKTNHGCYKRYKLKDSFSFDFNEENALRYEMLDKLIPFFDRFLSGDCPPIDFSCIYKGNIVEYRVEPDRVN